MYRMPRLLAGKRAGLCLTLAPLVCIAGGGIPACEEEKTSALPSLASELSSDATAAAMPEVRVLIAKDARRIRLRSKTPFDIVDAAGILVSKESAPQWCVLEATSAGTMRFKDTEWHSSSLRLIPKNGGNLTLSFKSDDDWSLAATFPGTVRVKADDTGRLAVVNCVDIEAYVACVVVNEVWGDFTTEAFRVQAIIARTFVLYQMQRRGPKEFHITATEASQVYRGLRTDAAASRAIDAARYTRGIVCVWEDQGDLRLLPTYYHSACGGRTQPADTFIGHEGIAPLRGGVECDFCKIAPKGAYRWGPVELPADEVLRRLVRRYSELASLDRIVGIEVAERTAAGRPVSLRIIGRGGRTHRMLAEHFRLAIGSRVARSTDCAIRVVDNVVILEDGRGFGHGLGLCQWGMQGQTLVGKKASQVLRYYYPESGIARAY